ncbi:MAG: hypothetical protein IKS64_02675 [Muribaculaceae bacterium]|nr:hypothetical protein [Muribaculaceae bacterium]MBR6431732.1 hypothetical protein [Muribaculaceae bacterium]
MKKILFSFAITAVAMLGFTACDGNSENNASGDDNVTTEETVDSAAVEAEVPIKELKSLECKDYVLTIPEGAEASSRMVNSSCNFRFKGEPYTTAAPNVIYKTLDEFKSGMAEKNGKALDDITVGDKTYTVYSYEKNNEQFVEAATPIDGDRMMFVRIFNGASKMDKAEAFDILVKNTKATLENIKIK